MQPSWEAIIEAALRTPSPHNTQPWRIKIRSDREATLFMERARMLPDEDTTGHFLRCAMGLFLEALKVLAANHGHELRHSLIAEESSAPLIRFAELKLKPGCPSSPYSNDLFQDRLTSRLPSNGKTIDPDVTTALENLAPELGQTFRQVDDAALIETIIQENIRAVFHDLNVRAYHDEIARWFRYSDEEARTKGDGLDHRCMGVPASQLRLMRALPQIMQWPITRNIIWPTYRRQIGKVSHLGIISGPFFDDTAAVQAGAYLMRLWLELSRCQIFIHPFGNLVTNADAKARVRELTGIDDIWLVFRIGHTDAPPKSLRRSLNEVLLHD